MTTRLEKYRAFIQRLSLTSPASAIEQDLYVPRPEQVLAEEIAARLEVNPTEALVLTGGVGVGKTTELTIASKRLDQLQDTEVFLVDVSELHDLSQLEPGVLLAAVGVQLCDWVKTKRSPKPRPVERWRTRAISA